MMFPRMLINQVALLLEGVLFQLTAPLRLVYNPHSCFPLISQFDVNNCHLMTNATIFYRFTVSQTGSTSCLQLVTVCFVLSCPVLFVVPERFRFVYSELFLYIFNVI